MTWAQASYLAPSPAPAAPVPLPALGAAAAFGFSRKIKKRFRDSANPLSNTYSL